MRKESATTTKYRLEAEFYKMLYRGSYNEWKKWYYSSAAKDVIIEALAQEIERQREELNTESTKAKAA